MSDFKLRDFLRPYGQSTVLGHFGTKQKKGIVINGSCLAQFFYKRFLIEQDPALGVIDGIPSYKLVNIKGLSSLGYLETLVIVTYVTFAAFVPAIILTRYPRSLERASLNANRTYRRHLVKLSCRAFCLWGQR